MEHNYQYITLFWAGLLTWSIVSTVFAFLRWRNSPGWKLRLIPEETGVVYGWRQYGLEAFTVSPPILSGTYGKFWQGPEFEAECDRDAVYYTWRGATVGEHLVSGLCTCGIYAHRSGDFLWAYNLGTVVALCVLWGTVSEHEEGYRATNARIERLYVCDAGWTGPNAHIDGLYERYKVPIVRVPYPFMILKGNPVPIVDVLDGKHPSPWTRQEIRQMRTLLAYWNWSK